MPLDMCYYVSRGTCLANAYFVGKSIIRKMNDNIKNCFYRKEI